jgi:predicted acyltransferase
MLALVIGNTWVFRQLAKEFPNNKHWAFLSDQFSHVPWNGVSFWDLIQPSFLFLAGLSIPFSYSKRIERGQTITDLLGHAIYRSIVLILLGLYISSPFEHFKNIHFNNILVQIGLTYIFAFLVVKNNPPTQLGIALGILTICWGAFALYPLSDHGLEYSTGSTQVNILHFSGFFAHWNIDTNLAASFDQWFLNLFPREQPYRPSIGETYTINFIPSVANMIFGLTAGEFLRTNKSQLRAFKYIAGSGFICILLGLLLGQMLCPIVKSIWTPSWAIYSTGWSLCLFSCFFWLIDVKGKRRWTFPLVVVGMNSITIYCMSMTGGWWFLKYWKLFLGEGMFDGTDGLIWSAFAVVFSLWLVCVILHRIRLFIRI